MRMSPSPSASLAVRFRVADAAADGQRRRRAAEEIDGRRVAGSGQHLEVLQVDLAFLCRAGGHYLVRNSHRLVHTEQGAEDRALCF